MPITQSERIIQFSSPLGADKLLFWRMNGEEGLGRPYTFSLDLLSEEGELDPDAILGRNAVVELEAEGGEKTRYFNGFVSRFAYVGTHERYFHYRVVLRPWLWFLTRTSDCRIFQEKSAVEIIKEVFRDNGFSDFSDRLSGTCRTRTYCVQYRESDFNFTSRLMQEEGIYYYFEHERGKHTLVLADGVGAHTSLGDIEYLPPDEARRHKEGYIDAFSVVREVETGKVVLNDFDFEKPSTALETRAEKAQGHEMSKMEAYDYPGLYREKSDGNHYADTRIEEEQVGHELMSGSGRHRGLGAGELFTLTDYGVEGLNREYLVVSAQYALISDAYVSGGGGGEPFACGFTVIDAQRPFRPSRSETKPVVQGPQTAMVVGPKGDEIYTDKYGRVKVQFHWDRYGESDENSSCWIRVAQIWAGKQWGGIIIPRIGQEVIVDFLEGDPDRPIITGRVYNAESMPPYGLPDNKTQTGLKTRSTKSGDGSTFNELRFEDKKGEEEVYFHAEKDFNRVVENNDTLKVGFDDKDKGDRSVDIFNNHTVNIGTAQASDGSETVTIWKDRTVTLKTGNDTLTIKTGNQTVQISAGKSTTTAMQSIELKVGSNSIKIDQTGITLKGIMIKIQAQATAEMKSPMTTVSGDGMLTLKGGIILIN